MEKINFKLERTPEEIEVAREKMRKVREAKSSPGANQNTAPRVRRKASRRKDGESVEDYLDRIGAADDALDTLIDIQNSKTATPSERKSAAQRILEIRYGKPTQKIDQSGVQKIIYECAVPDLVPEFPPIPQSDEVADAERQAGTARAD